MPLSSTNDKSSSEAEETLRNPDGDGHTDGFAYENCSAYDDKSACEGGDGDAKDSNVVDHVANDSDSGAGGVGSSQEHAIQNKNE